MKGFIVTIALFLFSLPAFTQAVTGCFFIETDPTWQAKGYSPCKRGCIPLKVIVDDTCSNVYIATNPANPHPSYLWGDNGTTKYIETDTHTYYKPGTYTVVQLITPNSGTTTFDTLHNYFQALPIPQPIFTVSSCYNKIVKVAVTDTTYDFYTINFGDGSVDTVTKNSNTTYTYADTVSKIITVTGYYNNACGCHVPASKSITLFGKPVPPDVGSLSVASQSTNGQIALNDFNPLIYASYLTQWKTGLTGSYTTTNTISAGVTGPINFTNAGSTLNNQYCARIITYDQCTDTTSSTPLCSTILNVTAQNNQNTITWANNVTGTFKSYTIIRNGDTLAVLTSPSNSYIDKNVRCGVQYCYQVVYAMQATDLAGNNLTSVSAPICTTAISTTVPPAVTGLTATVVNKNITLNWAAGSGVKSYLINKTVNGTSAGNAAVTTNSYIDPAVIVPEDEYCYAVSYSDSCGNTSPQSNTVCPSILNVTDNNGTITLNWITYACSDGSTATYTINVLDNNGAIVTSYPVGSNQSFILPTVDSTDKTLNYQVVVSCGTSSVYSNTYTIERSLKLYVPNAFTPNGDGNNDVFAPKGKYLKNYKMTIFNRWGEIVFYTDTYNGWDGTFKGDPALIDSYAYAITATDIWGGETTKRGTVTLLK